MRSPDLVEIVGDAIASYYEGFGYHPGITRAYGAAEAVVPALIRVVEGPRGSGLCDCDAADSPPTNPSTSAPMDHHCDCRAVDIAATLLGAYSKTSHAKQCGHGIEMDEHYRGTSG